jgi:hypothetical protein
MLTGKLPLLLGAEELDKQFWSGTKPGRAMLEQVCASSNMLRYVQLVVLCNTPYMVQHMSCQLC